MKLTAFATALLIASLPIVGHTQNVTPQFDEYGHAAVQTEHGWRYVDRDGKVILTPFIFDNGPDYYEEGLARFVDNGKMGFHDKSLTIVIPARYDFAFPFKNGTARAGMDCQRQPVGEYHTVDCKHWETLPHPSR